MNKDEFDRLFDESIDKMENSKPDDHSSDYRPSWKKVKKKIRSIEKSRNRKTFLRNVSIVFISMFLGAFIFGNMIETKAFNPFYQTFKEMPGDIASFFFGNQDKDVNDAKTEPPTIGAQSNEVDISEEIKTVHKLEEVQKNVEFPIPSFGYVPQGYKFKNADLFILQGEDISNKVRFTFSNQEKSFWVTLSSLDSDTTVGSGANSANINKVQLKHGEGYLTVSKDGSSKLEFLKGNVYVIVLGELPKEELILFADNM
ncbi:DUF4367 domain-containing protein [Aquibacillus sp. 3ASR75-11]|uniref:DUF4367 domain-containing protein n=1 Tax=Terrihalobacillus insolitus TaxID=2950438 RepID=A0A9X4AMB0_9BACI|nr:DUF4367 domain-containing protein [Terrihalobacillus insolitus]MDC3425096.1 DUF4367 domain-containing protein [Terrihalobacillus insolitus]